MNKFRDMQEDRIFSCALADNKPGYLFSTGQEVISSKGSHKAYRYSID